MSELTAGTIVTALYKTGKYIGEITEIRAQSYLVTVLGVLKHPMQGDLHHPKIVEGVFFHERKALGYKEKMNAPKQMVKVYEGSIPSYKESLQQAVNKMEGELIEDSSDYAQRSLHNLNELKKEYALN
ncbi:kinase-associated lipoprotein B [Niallia sp. 01092]|uniref:kinase-associated lipoprotein B n=1 Tax=unclassified Niallia TaxID=2837522 RepID=UPI003FD080D9